tara:strand:+ start:679 stop:1851 length:1173 start_codon:yes stop_codon:yes gene_type:complete
MNSMPPIEQSFQIKYDYKLFFTEDLFSVQNPLFADLIKKYNPKNPVKILFVIDDGVYKNSPDLTKNIKAYCDCYKAHINLTNSLIIPGGESIKGSYKHVEDILKAINDNRICRHSFVIAIGGGAVVDMVGYAAATAHRGVKLIRIPTTVLAQNDAAVGVKNSVNAFGKKNFLGTFSPPYAIINDKDFLNTLDHREWIAGIAEAVKVALIKDAEFFNYIEENALKLRDRDMKSMDYIIYRCAQLHMQHIAQGGDPFESGSSRPLDFGHWAAHKLEQMTNYDLRHGEAVAKGMALDLTYAHLIGLISQSVLDQILNVLQNIGFNLQIPVTKDEELNILLNGLEEFREHLGGELTITLINKIGDKHDVHEIDLSKMKEAISMLNVLSVQNTSV